MELIKSLNFRNKKSFMTSENEHECENWEIREVGKSGIFPTKRMWYRVWFLGKISHLLYPFFPSEWALPASWRWRVEERRTNDWPPDLRGKISSPPSPPSTWTSAGRSTSSPPPPSPSTMDPWTREASW